MAKFITIINLINENITLMSKEGLVVESFKPSTNYKTFEMDFYDVKIHDKKHPISMDAYIENIGLPNPRLYVWYIVPEYVAYKYKDRNDLFVPDKPVYDGDKNIIGYRYLGIIG